VGVAVITTTNLIPLPRRYRRRASPRNPLLIGAGLLTVAFLGAYPTSGAGGFADVMTKEQVVAACPPALRRLEAAYKQVRGRGTTSFRNLRGVQKERAYEVSFAFDGERARFVETVVKYTFPDADQNLGRSFATVVSPKLSFQLQRRPNQDYVTDWMGTGSDKPGSQAIQRRIDSHFQIFNRPYRLPTWLPVASLIEHPTFVARKISEASADGTPAVRIDFEVTPSDKKDDPLLVWHGPEPIYGFFVACPTRSWALHEYEEHGHENATKSAVVHHGSAHYRIDEEGVPLLIGAEEKMSVNGVDTGLSVIALN
jgi:hypothetical protein